MPVRYAEPYGLHTGRSRRVIGPARLHVIGYRAGAGPNTPGPQPGPNPAAGPGPQPGPQPQPTPNPQPGPAPPAKPPPLPGGGLDLGAAINTVLGDLTSAGQVLLGGVVLGVGVLLLVSETSVGGAVAKGVRSGVKRGLRAVPGVGALV